jgi:hypothetical protein
VGSVFGGEDISGVVGFFAGGHYGMLGDGG